MEIVGYLLAILVGVCSGLIGAGGSILAIPILVYVLDVEAAITAPAYSLFIVGFSSLIGAFLKYRKHEINLKDALFFGLPTIIGIYVTRKFGVPLIPEVIFETGSFVLTKRLLIMGIFAVIMIIAALIMIKENLNTTTKTSAKNVNIISFFGGLMVGGLSGLVGAGGGFLIVPALINFKKMDMKIAVGTSLAIITLNSFFGFVGSIGTTTINWKMLIVFTTFAIVGIVIGNHFSKKANSKSLKKGFGWFVLIMGTYIFIKELFFN